MTNWLVKRHSKSLGHCRCERLHLEAGTLYAMNCGRIIGSVASGPGLSWAAGR
jgi:hypothetical protein